MADDARKFAGEEIEATIAEIEEAGKIEQAPKAAAMLRQLLGEAYRVMNTFDQIASEVCAAIGIPKSERPAHWILGIRDLHRERDEAKSEVVDAHRALLASEDFRREYTRFCMAIPEALAKDGNWPPAEKSAWEKLWLSMPVSHGPLERKTREVEIPLLAELADLRAYRQRRESEDNEDALKVKTRRNHFAEALAIIRALATSVYASDSAAEVAAGADPDDLDDAVQRAIDFLSRHESPGATPEQSSAVQPTLTVAEAEAWATRAALWGVIIGEGASANDKDMKTPKAEFIRRRVSEAADFIANEMVTDEEREMAAAAVARARGERT